MIQFKHTIAELLGLDVLAGDLQFSQLILRAIIVCIVMYAMLRLAGRRFLAQKNTFDVLLAFIIASMMSRAINGTTNFWGTLGIGFTIVAVYRLLAWWISKAHRLGQWVKGDPQLLVEKGVVRPKALSRNNISENDLKEDVRLNAGVDDLKRVRMAWLERNGDISVQRQPQVLEIKVEAGVQTVRLFIE